MGRNGWAVLTRAGRLNGRAAAAGRMAVARPFAISAALGLVVAAPVAAQSTGAQSSVPQTPAGQTPGAQPPGAALPGLQPDFVSPSTAKPAVSEPTSPYRQPAQITATDTDDPAIRASSGVPGLAGFPGRGLSLTASITTRYETNLSRRQVADDGVRITPVANLEYGLGGQRLGLFVQGSYGRDIIQGNAFFRGGDRYSISGGVDASLSRCTAQLGSSYSRSLNLFGEVTQFGGATRRATTYGVTAQCRLGSALGVNAGFNRSDSSNNFGNRALEIEATNFNAGVSLNSGAVGTISLTGSLSQIDMPGRQVVTPQGIVDEGLNQRTIGIAIARNFGPRISVSAGVNYISSQPEVESSLLVVDGVPQFVDRAGFSGLGYNAAIDFRPSSRFNVELSASRTANANVLVSALLMVSNQIGIAASTSVGRFSVSTGARFRSNNFRGAFVSEFDPVIRSQDRMQSYFFRVGGRIGLRMRFAIEANHNRRRGGGAGINFSSTGVGLNLGMSLGRGSR